MSHVHAILAGVAELFLLIEEPQQAAGLLVPILRDPASDRETCDHARTLLSRCAALLSPQQYAAATHGAQAIDLPAVFAALQLASGGAAIPPSAGAGIASLPAPKRRLPPSAQTAQPLIEPLTERELAVLRLIADGQSNQQIAAHLIIAPGTAKWYVSQIFGKLGVHSRTQVIVRARSSVTSRRSSTAPLAYLYPHLTQFAARGSNQSPCSRALATTMGHHAPTSLQDVDKGKTLGEGLKSLLPYFLTQKPIFWGVTARWVTRILHSAHKGQKTFSSCEARNDSNSVDNKRRRDHCS